VLLLVRAQALNQSAHAWRLELLPGRLLLVLVLLRCWPGCWWLLLWCCPAVLVLH
jgi:hypothetical protein